MVHLPADDQLDPRLTFGETYLSHWQYWEGRAYTNEQKKERLSNGERNNHCY